MDGLIQALVLVGSLASAAPTLAQIPPGYYDPAMGLTGNSLREALHGIIDDHTVIPYNSTAFDVRDAIEILDEDPINPNNVVLIYSGFSVPKSSWPDWNREHLWPVSLGTATGSIPYSDLHHLFACDAGVNSLRSNRYFDDCEVDCAVPSEAPSALYNFTTWEPPDDDKGDVARAIFYMDIRYNGDTGGEPAIAVANVSSSTGCECIGYLDTLLTWHDLDPVSATELDRNDMIYDLMQDNRNPFIDHPEYAAAIWGAPEFNGICWINEIHYDNSGADIDEGVEIAGPAGTSLLGWTLTAYNGNGFESYDSIHLTGTLPDEGDGFGALWFPIAGLQNGSPDGVALVRPDNAIEEFLSYEGTIPAIDGPAEGLTSNDLGVSESGSPVGESLQRIGLGAEAADFTWTGPVGHSRGLLNAGQSFISPGPTFVRGDCNADGGYNIADAIRILDLLFGTTPPPCDDACDTNNDGGIDIADAVFLLTSLFSLGADPPAPFPNCGTDTGAVSLGCGSFAACP